MADTDWNLHSKQLVTPTDEDRMLVEPSDETAKAVEVGGFRTWLMNTALFSTLTTAVKNIIGAINELKEGVDNNTKSIVDNTTSLNANTKNIEEKYLSIKNNVLYTAALKDLNKSYDFINCKGAIKNGALKIAIVGDSITEGANNYSQDVWCNKFIESLKSLYPNLTINYCNFALGGRNSSQFVNTNYKAVNPETDATQHFWRSWATVGKSWIDHVCDYKADLVIYAFGINDVGGSPDELFYNNLVTSLNYIKSKKANTDFVLVTPLEDTRDNLPTWGSDEQENLCIARILREYAKTNNYGLIDTNRLWRILLFGIDYETFTNKELTSIDDINKEISYNFSTKITFNSSTYPTNKDIQIRKYNNKFLLLRFTTINGQNSVQLYNNSNLLKTWSNTTQTVEITVRGCKIIVNGETYNCYLHMFNGALNFSALNGYINSIYFNNRVEIKEKASLDEKDLLGVLTNPVGQGINGNGINHPTTLGHYLTYYMASQGVLNSIGKIKYEDSAILTDKTAINGIQAEGEYYIYNATDSPDTCKHGYVKVRKLPQYDEIYLHQTFYPFNVPGTFYIRVFDGGAGWSKWFKYSGAEVSQ